MSDNPHSSPLSGMLSNASGKLIAADDKGIIFAGEVVEILSSLAAIISAVLAVRYITEVSEMQQSQSH